MRIYIIANDGITLCSEAPATMAEGEIAVASKEELHSAPLSGKRLLALWNALPGVEKRKKVGDRAALIDQLWAAIETLPEPQSDTKRRSKQGEVIAMLHRPEGATVDEVASAMGWQRHTVRGLFSGTLKTTTPEDLPDNIAALRTALVAERAKRIEEAARAARVEAELAVAKAKASDDQAVIAHQQLQIAKLTRQLYGQRSERTVRLLDQMELALEELESTATEDEIAAERAVAKTTNVVAFTRKRPARQPFPEHLPRERVIEPGPTVCLCCGSPRRRKLGEDITETLEVIPRQWKVIQHVREKFTCRDCEKISQAPAPFHVIARGWAGPSLLAMILFEKYSSEQYQAGSDEALRT